MRKRILSMLFLSSFILILGWAVADLFGQESEPAAQVLDGKAVFVAQKCNLCHSVQSAEVEMVSGGYQKSSEKNVPPDLSGIGKKRTADFMSKYLKKKEAIEGVQHARLFRGTDAELETLAKWLETLK